MPEIIFTETPQPEQARNLTRISGTLTIQSSMVIDEADAIPRAVIHGKIKRAILRLAHGNAATERRTR